jgi:hypothetical protein
MFRYRHEDERIEQLVGSPAQRASYDRLCEKLSRNDPATTEVPRLHLPLGHGYRLGEALQNNTNVTIFHLKVRTWVKHDFHNTVEASEHGAVQILIRFLFNSPSLRQVHMYTGHGFLLEPPPTGWHICALALHTISVNSNITHFTLGGNIDVPPNELGHFIATTRSITTLKLVLDDWFDGHLYRLPLLTCFERNQSIQSLTLHHIASTRDIVASILPQLRGRHQLNELHLMRKNEDNENDVDDAQTLIFGNLALLLASSESLRVLSLSNYAFREEDWNFLQPGLHAASIQTLEELAFCFCMFDVDSTYALVQCLQSPVTAAPSLRKLTLLGNDEVIGGSVAGKLVLVPQDAAGSTTSIGSSLQVMELNPSTAVGLSTVWLENPWRLRLPMLRIDVMDASAYEELVKCLPRMLYLSELHIDRPPVPGIVPQLANALQQNGSLQHVTFEGEVFPVSHHNRTIYLYRLRNQGIVALRQILGERTRSAALLGGSLETQQDGDDTDGPVNPMLMPLYFHLVKPVVWMTPNFILMGLLAMSQAAHDESI